ncbi:hypothetical protein C2W64_04558 [Brevibacillus laterosporus]|nr:hypothetical protein C2W64_04558 [Brevibacillus laterosporus]
MEISENEHRKEFTFTERVDWAREKAGKKIDPVENLPQGSLCETDNFDID